MLDFDDVTDIDAGDLGGLYTLSTDCHVKLITETDSHLQQLSNISNLQFLKFKIVYLC